MKHIIILIISLLWISKIYSQECNMNTSNCENGNGVSTNIANPTNPNCSSMRNNFDWRVQRTDFLPEDYIVYGPGTIYKEIQNPFTGPTGAPHAGTVTNQRASNYQPEDGWELLKVEFGIKGNVNINNDPNFLPNLPTNYTKPKLPYMILYNKYSGTMRFFGSLLDANSDYETLEIILTIPSKDAKYQPNNSNNDPIDYNENLKSTNLLSIQGDAVQPLDQETDENVIVVFAKATNNPSQFFWFDIPVAYDPCVGGMRMDRNGNKEFRGNLTTTKVNIQTNWWCDFVFAFDYKLRSLQEVESFINTNKHLPDMPSEAEGLENGIDVADMQALQQQKIEQLTLYIIQLQKQVEVMKLELEDLKQ
jgi:hypothetical protein